MAASRSFTVDNWTPSLHISECYFKLTSVCINTALIPGAGEVTQYALANCRIISVLSYSAFMYEYEFIWIKYTQRQATIVDINSVLIESVNIELSPLSRNNFQ
jgi:hypothetical protein